MFFFYQIINQPNAIFGLENAQHFSRPTTITKEQNWMNVQFSRRYIYIFIGICLNNQARSVAKPDTNQTSRQMCIFVFFFIYIVFIYLRIDANIIFKGWDKIRDVIHPFQECECTMCAHIQLVEFNYTYIPENSGIWVAVFNGDYVGGRHM